MKKLSLIVAGLSVLVGLTVQAADTNAVTSVNIVGLIKTDLPSNKLVFASVSMNAVGGTNQMFQPTLGDQLPLGGSVYFWNVSSQRWDIATKKSKIGWSDNSNRVVSVGQGIFILCPSTNLTINMLGEVPLSPTSTVSMVQGLNAIGYMYPVDMAWTNTPFYGLPLASVLNVWNVTSQKWDIATKKSKIGWSDASNWVLRAGQGFFVTVPAATNLYESRPFNP